MQLAQSRAVSIIKTSQRPMTQVQQVAIVTPLTVGAGAVLCPIFIHGLALGATVLA
jgi:hypothetical protein